MCIKLKKLFAAFTVVCVIVFCICSTAFAASKTYTTYSDVTASTTTIQNLLTLRTDKQTTKRYVAFRTESEYVLLISDDFSVNGSTVSCEDCDVIVYNSSYGSNNATRYYSTSYSSCSLSVSHVVVSNFLEGASRPDSSDYNNTVIVVLICILAVLAFWVIRRFK